MGWSLVYSQPFHKCTGKSVQYIWRYPGDRQTNKQRCRKHDVGDSDGDDDDNDNDNDNNDSDDDDDDDSDGDDDNDNDQIIIIKRLNISNASTCHSGFLFANSNYIYPV